MANPFAAILDQINSQSAMQQQNFGNALAVRQYQDQMQERATSNALLREQRQAAIQEAARKAEQDSMKQAAIDNYRSIVRKAFEGGGTGDTYGRMQAFAPQIIEQMPDKMNEYGQLMERFKPAAPDPKVASEAANRGFLSAISNLTLPSAMGSEYPISNTGIKTGYAPLPTTINDITSAGESYGADPKVMQDAIKQATELHGKIRVQGKPEKVGRTTMTPEYDLYGNRKDEGKGTEIRVISGGGVQTKPEKPLPSAVYNELKTDLGTFSDWNGVANTYSPSYSIPAVFKSIADVEQNINKIFAKNPSAAIWWMDYFKARNKLMKTRSGAAVVENELKRFEQESISGNTNPNIIRQYLNSSVNEYDRNLRGNLAAYNRAYPEAISAMTNAYGYGQKQSSNVAMRQVEPKSSQSTGWKNVGGIKVRLKQ